MWWLWVSLNLFGCCAVLEIAISVFVNENRNAMSEKISPEFGLEHNTTEKCFPACSLVLTPFKEKYYDTFSDA